MVLVIHDFSDRTIRFETHDKKIIWRGLANKFTDEVALKHILPHCGLNISSIWDIRLWRLIQLYHMFIEKNEGKIDFGSAEQNTTSNSVGIDNGIATDSKNKIKYILVMGMNFELDNNYSCILLLYAPYGLSKTLENKIITSDLTVHFIILKD